MWQYFQSSFTLKMYHPTLHGFLNQARAWFLKIDPVQIVGMHVRVFVCPCPRLLITSGVMWHDMNLI